MMPSDVMEMFATIVAFDGRQEPTETDAEAWHAAFAFAGLADLTLEDARVAVVQHYATTRQWIMPVDVIDRCKRIRRERLKVAGDLYALVQADPTDGPAYHAEYQRIHAEIASGRITPAQLETS